jgi:acyl-CoA dehydrogenase
MYQPQGETDIVRVIESAVAATLAAEPIDARIREAQKAGRLTVKAGEDQAAIALAASIITADELTMVQRAKRLVDQVIRVDDFAPDLGVSEVRPLAVTPAAADAVARKAAA